MKILRMEKLQPRKLDESRDTKTKAGLRKTDWEVLAQHDRFTGKLNLRCEAALKDPAFVKRLLEAGMIDPKGTLTPKGRKKCAALTEKLEQPETPGHAVPDLPKAEPSHAPEDKPADKLTASDWALLMKYDRKTGNLLAYDPETGQLDQTSRAILRDPSIIQRLIENNMILPGGWLTPEAKQECNRIEEKLKNQPADDYPDSKNAPRANLQPKPESGAKRQSPEKAAPEPGKESRKTEPEAKADAELERFSDKLSKIYAEPKGSPELKIDPKLNPNPEPAKLSDAKPAADAGPKQQPEDSQASPACAVRQHYPDPKDRLNPNSEPVSKPGELSKGEREPNIYPGRLSKQPSGEDLQAFFENLPLQDPGTVRKSNVASLSRGDDPEPALKDMHLPDGTSDTGPAGDPEHALEDGRQSKLLPEHLQTGEPEKAQQVSKTAVIPIKGSVYEKPARSVDLRPVSKPEDRHKQRPKRRQRGPGGGEGDITEPPSFSLRDVFHIIFKRKLQVLICFILIVSVAAVGTFLMKPVYEASTQILVKLGRESVFTPTTGSVAPILNIDREEQVNSEIEIIKSRVLAEKVVTALGPTTLYPNLKEEKSGIFNLIMHDRRREMTPAERKAADFESALAGFMKALGVMGIKKSNVVQISFKHQDPQMAAMVVNTLANMYLDEHLAVHKAPQNVKFFQEQTGLLKNKLEQTEEKLKALKKQHNITSLEQQRTLLLGQSSELKTGLNETISVEAETEKRIRQLGKQLESVPQTISEGVETDQNPYLMNTLEAKLVELQLEEKELLTKYTDESRLVQNVKEEIRVVQQKLKEQATKSYGSRTSTANPTYQKLKEELLSNEAEIEALRAKKNTQKQHLDDLQAQLENLNQVELELNELEQQIEVDRENYRLYLTKVEESRISDAMDTEKIASVSVIGPARPPHKPVSPKVMLNILIGIFLGIFGSLSLALFREYLDDRIEKIEDVEKELELPVLASIPVFNKKAAGLRS